ncbi:hypothetical protein RZS08_57040, partial [Arthrospira platensis SPKY1]|nr:hypothetical protein [Arthrospira platensis SPKY1]
AAQGGDLRIRLGGIVSQGLAKAGVEVEFVRNSARKGGAVPAAFAEQHGNRAVAEEPDADIQEEEVLGGQGQDLRGGGLLAHEFKALGMGAGREEDPVAAGRFRAVPE